MNKTQIIAAIEAHAKTRGIAPATVTSRSVGNSRLYQRLLNGGDCTTEVAARIISWIENDALTAPAPDAASERGAA